MDIVQHAEAILKETSLVAVPLAVKGRETLRASSAATTQRIRIVGRIQSAFRELPNGLVQFECETLLGRRQVVTCSAPGGIMQRFHRGDAFQGSGTLSNQIINLFEVSHAA